MRIAKRERGTCPRCEGVVALEGDRLASHDRWYGAGRGHGIYMANCNGSGRRPLEVLTPQRDKARAKRLAAVDAVRDEASVVLDAYLARRNLDDLDFIDQLHHFYELAFTQYRVRFPKARPDKCGYSWNRTMKKNGYVNCHCIFCGDFLGEMPVAWKVKDTEAAKARWNKDGPIMERHVHECALMVVAGLCEPVAPGTRNLQAQEAMPLPLFASLTPTPGGAG